MPSDDGRFYPPPTDAAELAVLSLPGLVLLRPILKGFNIAGLFGVDFKEITENAARAAEEQALRLATTTQALAKVEQAAPGVDEQSVTDLPLD